MEWSRDLPGGRVPVKSWCRDVEPGAMKQAADLAAHPAARFHVALMPDCHQGYGMPIGGVVPLGTRTGSLQKPQTRTTTTSLAI